MIWILSCLNHLTLSSFNWGKEEEELIINATDWVSKRVQFPWTLSGKHKQTQSGFGPQESEIGMMGGFSEPTMHG